MSKLDRFLYLFYAHKPWVRRRLGGRWVKHHNWIWYDEPNGLLPNNIRWVWIEANKDYVTEEYPS